tara:strand:- start:12 stop:398 length:387 start_codon:yes stop_codon:yes gene_type:complete
LRDLTEDPGLPTYSTNAVQVNFDGQWCNANQRAILTEEFNHAYEMAAVTRDNLQNGRYFNDFFDQPSRNDPGFAGRTRNVYDHINSSKSLDFVSSPAFIISPLYVPRELTGNFSASGHQCRHRDHNTM